MQEEGKIIGSSLRH